MWEWGRGGDKKISFKTKRGNAVIICKKWHVDVKIQFCTNEGPVFY
jgi:hypothetical protein